MEYAILFGFSLIVLLSVFHYNNGDYLCPSVIYSFGYFLCFFVALINSSNWGNTISLKTVFVFIIGISSFVIVDCILKNNVSKPFRKQQNPNILYIGVDNVLLLIVLLASTIIVYFNYKEIVRIGEINSLSSSLSLIQSYKTSVAMGQEGSSLSPMLQQLLKIPISAAYISGFVFVNNYYACKIRDVSFKDNKIRNILLLCLCLSYLIQRLLMGERFSIIAFLFTCCVIFLIYRKIYYYKAYKLRIFGIVKIAFAVIGLMLLFYYLKEVFGRTGEYSLTEYIGFYMGGEVPLLDNYLKDVSNIHYGSLNMIHFVYSLLEKIGFDISTIPSEHSFQFSQTGIQLGNAYSALRIYYHDLGILGCILFPGVYAFIFRLQYEKIGKIISSGKTNNFRIVLFMYFYHVILYQFFTDYLFSKFEFGTLTELAVMYLLFIAMTKMKISHKGIYR